MAMDRVDSVSSCDIHLASGLAFGNVGFNFSGYTNSITETPRHFAINATPTVVINNDIGSIHVRSGGAESDVTILATKYAGFGGNVNDVQVTILRMVQLILLPRM